MIPNEPNTSEQQLLDLVANKEGRLSEVVPEEMEAALVLDWIKASASLIHKADRVHATLIPVLGKLLNRVRQDRGILKAWGMKTIGDLERHLEETIGVSRTRLWQYGQIAEKNPDLTLQQYADIGIEKLSLVSRYSSHENSGHSNLIEAAAALPLGKFKQHLTEVGIAGSVGEMSGSVLTITGNREQIQEIRAFLESLDVQQHVGATQPVEILIALIGDAQAGDWPKV